MKPHHHSHLQILNFFKGAQDTGVIYKNKALKKGILKELDLHGDNTIPAISKSLNVSVPKTTCLIQELIKEGLLEDKGKVSSTGGRRASTFGLVSQACFFLGVDVKRFHISLGILDFNKHLVSLQEKVPYQLENTRPSYTQLLRIINGFLRKQSIEKSKVLGAGVNLSGRVNSTSGYSYSYFHFGEEPLAEIMQQDLGIPVFLENDSRAMALGEFGSGETGAAQDVLFVNADYGIGMGMLLNGQLYYGKSGFSGEFGHIPFFDNEILCHCGKKGCLETESSGFALLRKFKEKIEQGHRSIAVKGKKDLSKITLPDLIQAVLKEDMLCIELLSEVGENIGRGLALLMNLFNPELLVLGGSLAVTGDYLRLPVKTAINKYSLALVNSDTQLIISRLGDKAGVLGACLNARYKVLSR